MLLESPGLQPVSAPRAAVLGRRRRRLAAVLALALVVTACTEDSGGDRSAGSSDDEAAAPSTTTTTTSAGAGEDSEGIEQVALQGYATRPDLSPPVIDVVRATSLTPGYVFLAPKRAGAQAGPLIVDDRGETVWAAPRTGNDVAGDFRVQTYQGEPVLTWWEGRSAEGRGFGELVIADRSYREIARLQTGNGREADFHEFRLTAEGTALLLAYSPEEADLSAVGGPADGHAFESYIQEVDVATGDVLMEWKPSDHIPVSDTYSELTEDEDGSEAGPFDWFHANSVAPGPDGTLLVSARNTHAIYAIDRATGELRWRLGGKSSDIALGEGAGFRWQHDAQWLGGNRISLFDNHASLTSGEASRALVLDVDTQARTAAVVSETPHPDALSAGTQGNTQVLGGGGLFVGWGSAGRVTEFSPAGDVVFDATFAPADSYRGYRFEWTGLPEDPPDVVVAPARDEEADVRDEGEDGDGDGDGQLEVAVSWNGATEVVSWRVMAGDDPDDLTPVAQVRKDGFETTTRIERAEVVAVEALDGSGEVLARSDPVTVEG